MSPEARELPQKARYIRCLVPHLEENGVISVPPEVCDRVAAVTPTGEDLQTSRALSVGARLA
jgi:hypothetical protein